MAAEWLNRISHATEWGIQQCPAVVNKYLPNTALGFTAASLIGAYFRSPMWLAGAAFGAYVSYKASPFQQLMTLRTNIIDQFPTTAGPKQQKQKDSNIQKLQILCSAHKEELTPNKALVNKMLDFMNGKCTRAELHKFPIVKPSITGTISSILKSFMKQAKAAKTLASRNSNLETLRAKVHLLLFRFANDLNTSRNARVPERLIQELEAERLTLYVLLHQQDPSIIPELIALQEILATRPNIELDERNLLACTITQRNCSFLALKLRNEMRELAKDFKSTGTVDEQWLQVLIIKFKNLHDGYQFLKACSKSIAFQKEYELSMHYTRGVIDLLLGRHMAELGTDQDDLPPPRAPAVRLEQKS